MIYIPIFSILLLAIDQIIKFIVTSKMMIADTIHVIKNFFRITYLQNTGGAFSILSGNVILIVIITLILFGIIIYIVKTD